MIPSASPRITNGPHEGVRTRGEANEIGSAAAHQRLNGTFQLVGIAGQFFGDATTPMEGLSLRNVTVVGHGTANRQQHPCRNDVCRQTKRRRN